MGWLLLEAEGPEATGDWRPRRVVPHCTLTLGLTPEQVGTAFEAYLVFGLPMKCVMAEVGAEEALGNINI